MTGSKRVCQIPTSASFDEAELRQNTKSGLKEDQSTLVEGAGENEVNDYCCSLLIVHLHDLGVACSLVQQQIQEVLFVGVDVGKLCKACTKKILDMPTTLPLGPPGHCLWYCATVRVLMCHTCVGVSLNVWGVTICISPWVT